MTENELLTIAQNAPENNSETIWEVNSVENGAVAAFSQVEYAKLLALYLKDNGDPLIPEDEGQPVIEPVAKERSATELTVDKYLPELKSGKIPFDIQMYGNGRLFEGGRANTVYEPVFNKTSDTIPTSLSGTFWANDLDEAIGLAEQYLATLEV